MTKMEKSRRMMGTVTAITTELSSPPAACEDSADFRKPEINEKDIVECR